MDVDSTAQFHIEKYEKGITNNMTLRLIESGFRNDSVAFLHFFFERSSSSNVFMILESTNLIHKIFFLLFFY